MLSPFGELQLNEGDERNSDKSSDSNRGIPKSSKTSGEKRARSAVGEEEEEEEGFVVVVGGNGASKEGKKFSKI